MPLQTLPAVARAHAASRRREIGAAVVAVQDVWATMGEDFDASFARLGPEMLAVADVAQGRVASAAQRYVPEVLTETGQPFDRRSAFIPDARSLVGTAGDGMPTESLLYGAVTRAKVAVGQGATSPQALVQGSRWLSTAVGTLLSDTSRSSERLAMDARKVTGYVRMLTPPSCGRCVILAGRRAHFREAFDRHPGCDCQNIPATEDVDDDMTTDPRAYLDGLDDAELAKALGSQANAQAYRDGADMNQLINAYRKSGDVRPAQVYGRTVKYTTEGTTRHGLYGRIALAPNGRRAPRLMPESIAKIATGDADRLRLLRLYGWVL